METLTEYKIDPVSPLAYDSPPQGELPMAPPAKTGIDWKGWTSLVLAGCLFVGGIVWLVHSELSRIDKSVAGLDKHIARVESAVRMVGAKQGGDTKTLVDEALAVAKNASDGGQTESAKTVLDIANRLLAEQKASREPAPQEFFDGVAQKYKELKKSPELSEAVWEGTTKLAEYRSETTSVPPGFKVHIGQLSQRGPFRYLKDSLLSGPRAMVMAGENGFVLDGFYLENVVFENATIVYKGGPVILQNVHFVNCQFDMRKSPQSEQLLEATVKQPVNVTIG
jgi:hypothetical protein